VQLLDEARWLDAVGPLLPLARRSPAAAPPRPEAPLVAAAPRAAPRAPVTAAARPAAASAAPAAVEVDASTEVAAYLRFVRGSPFKVRRVLDQIRGRSYEEALMILEYMPYKACEPVIKTLLSAAANAKHNMGLKKKDLVVSECYADGAPILKRFRPRAQGRPFPIHKPTLHLTVKVASRAAP
jgi:large subunit ribosomal protein L22